MERRRRHESGADFLPTDINPFNEKMVRKRFVSRVFSVVFVMLLPPFVMTFLPFTNDSLMEFYYYNTLALSLAGLFGFIVAVFSIVCCGSCRRNRVCGVILLVLCSFSMCLTLPAISSRFDVLVPLLALVVTAGVVLLTGILAAYGPCDVTGCGFLFSILGFLVLLYGLAVLIVSFIHPMPILHTIYSAIAVVLVVLYLWMDLQLILGGRRYEITTDEWVLAAAVLFTDIVTMFMHLISLIGALTGD